MNCEREEEEDGIDRRVEGREVKGIKGMEDKEMGGKGRLQEIRPQRTAKIMDDRN